MNEKDLFWLGEKFMKGWNLGSEIYESMWWAHCFLVSEFTLCFTIDCTNKIHLKSTFWLMRVIYFSRSSTGSSVMDCNMNFCDLRYYQFWTRVYTAQYIKISLFKNFNAIICSIHVFYIFAHNFKVNSVHKCLGWVIFSWKPKLSPIHSTLWILTDFHGVTAKKKNQIKNKNS